MDVARGYAEAYADYAADAESLTGNTPTGPGLAAAKLVLSAALVPAFSLIPPDQAADIIAKAFTAFWLAPPMVFAGTFPGVVTAVPGTAVLAPALTAAWKLNLLTLSKKPEATPRIAQVFHAFTSTVIVTDATTPVPTVGPIL